jgi:hypothetical protein
LQYLSPSDLRRIMPQTPTWTNKMDKYREETHESQTH